MLHNNLEDRGTSYQIYPDLCKEPEYVSLPSKGYFYTKKYKNIDKILINKISWEEESILTTKSYYDNDTVRYELLKSVIVDKEFPIIEMPQVDIDAILIWCYMNLHGVNYSVNYTCDCSHKTPLTWELHKLISPEYSLEVEKKIIKEEFFFNLRSNQFVLRPPNPLLVKKITSFLKRQQLERDTDFSSTSFLIASIKQINHENKSYKKYKEIYNYLKIINLNLQELRLIKKEIEKINLQITDLKSFLCKNCQEEQKINLSINSTFFGLTSQQEMNEYREYALESIDFLTFWGKIDSVTAMKMPVTTRKYRVWRTNENLKILYPK